MGLWDQLSLLFRSPNAPPSAKRLDGRSEPLLRASMNILLHGERGWITMKEASSPFSPESEPYAFGEMDEVGKHNLASFATKADCEFEFIPVEDRIYFARHRASKS